VILKIPNLRLSDSVVLGTLTVSGDLAFQQGGLYRFGVSGGSVGFTSVTGTASLTGANAQALFTGSTFANRYTILSAAAGLGGTQFATFLTNSPAITANLSYTATDVILNLMSGFTGTGGLTRNQTAVANALDSAFNTHGIGLTGLLGLSAGQLPAAFDALSGEGTSATQETAFGAGNVFTTLMMDQGAFWRSGASDDPHGVTYGSLPLNFAPEKAQPAPFNALPFNGRPSNAPAPAFEQRWRGWAAGFDSNSSLRGEADSGSATQSRRTGGGAAGIDYQVNPNLLIGAAAGGSSSSFSVPDRATSGNLDGAHLGTYGVARRGSWYAAGTLALSAFDNRISRTIAGVGTSELVTGRFGSDLVSGRFELGWTRRFNGFSVTPFAAVQVSELWQRGYTETGTQLGGAAGVNGLSYAARDVSSLPTFLGAQLDSRVVLANGMVWSPFARLSWVHEFEPTRDITASFIALPGSSFSVDGPRAVSDAARVDLGSKLAISQNAALFGSFDGEFSDRSRSYTGKGGFRTSW
jgi:outer membrane autotransporter protein